MFNYNVTAKVFARDGSTVAWEGELKKIPGNTIEEAIVVAKKKVTDDGAKHGFQMAPVIRITKIEELQCQPVAVGQGSGAGTAEAPVLEENPRFPRPRTISGKDMGDKEWAGLKTHLESDVVPILEKAGVTIWETDPGHYSSYLHCEHKQRKFTLSVNPSVPTLTMLLGLLPDIHSRIDRYLQSKTKTVYSSDIFRITQILSEGRSQTAVSELLTQMIKSAGIEISRD